MVTQIREMAEMMQRGWILGMEEKVKVQDLERGNGDVGLWYGMETGASLHHAEHVFINMSFLNVCFARHHAGDAGR